jgi:hypothetical protein
VRFSVDPWDPAYGTSLDTELGASTAEVVLDVEQPLHEWRPVGPVPGVAAPATVLFVDGVRRVDAQVWVEEEGGVAAPALCASYAAGVMCCCGPGGAHLAAARVQRGLFSTAPAMADIVTGAGTYAAVHVPPHPDRPPMQILSLALQRGLAATEVQVALAHRADHGTEEDDLIVVDGPLPRRPLVRAIGFVKSHRDSYLPAVVAGIVAGLAAGQRTPVFRICHPTWERFSWYLRLPAAPGAPWAGVVRVECGTDVGGERAVALAAVSQATLVRFASTEYKDARAPQNLYPIAGLERALRRRLGEPALLYRALRRAAAIAPAA